MFRLLRVFVILVLSTLSVSCGDSASTEVPDPAPIYGTQDPAAPGYIIYYKSGVDTGTETLRLATKYNFQPTHVFDAIGGFSADFSIAVLEQLRYETTIKEIHYNGTATLQ